MLAVLPCMVSLPMLMVTVRAFMATILSVYGCANADTYHGRGLIWHANACYLQRIRRRVYAKASLTPLPTQLLGLPMMLMPRSGWATFGEGFSERAYDSNGKEGPGKDEWYNLRPRDKPGAVIHDPAEAAQQVLSYV